MTLRLEGPGLDLPLKVNDDRIEPVWISIPDLRRRVVPAKVMVWFPLDENVCAAATVDSFSPTSVRVMVGGSDVETIERTYPLRPGFVEYLTKFCNEGSS